MSNSFYKAFEDRLRGSRDLIKARLQVYLPFVEPFRTIHDAPSALDLGCGRGEWLELLSENGFHARGVDLDDDMLGECRDRNLEVEREDAVTLLRRLPDESETIISGFHVAEHLPFPGLRDLVIEAWRVLKPAGLLILETPNPENLVVGASNFYLDPTHERPLPPGLLSFLAEHSGFERIKIVRLNEAHDLDAGNPVSLATVLKGVSPDYSIVAQKAAPRDALGYFDTVFDKQYGLTLEATLKRYDEQLGHKLNSILLEQRAERDVLEKIESELTKEREALERIGSEFTKEREALERIGSELTKEREAREHLESQLTEEREVRGNVEARLTAVYTSASWRITWPLRRLLDVVRWLLHLPVGLARRLLLGAVILVTSRPGLAARLATVLDRYPRLKLRITNLAVATGWDPPGANDVSDERAVDPDNLPETARRIYDDLKSAVEGSKKEND